MTAICFLDLETDGLHPGRRVWEFAAIRRDTTPDGEVTETEHHAFVGLDLRNSDPFGLNVGGYWDRHPSGRKISGKPPTPAPRLLTHHEAARELMRVTFDAHIVGVNPAFDADTLAGLLRSEGYLPAWNYHLADLIAMAAGKLAIQPPWRSDDLSRACGVEPPSDTDRHTALGDARWAKRWFDALTTGGAQGRAA